MTIRRRRQRRRRLDATTTIAFNQCDTKHKIDNDNKHDDDNDDDDEDDDDVGEGVFFCRGHLNTYKRVIAVQSQAINGDSERGRH